MEIKKVKRRKVKLKIGLSGASGFGKTYSALLLARGMSTAWDKIAVIDTENGSASLYSNLGDYNTLELNQPFHPDRYIEAIQTCQKAGMEVIIIDSITPEWSGKGGCLDIHEQEKKKMSRENDYTAWNKVTPLHRKFIDSILQSDCHIITTVRRKQDYDMVKEGEKTKVVKVGTKEETREGFEYELTINFELINDKHYAKASKDRTSLFMDKEPFVINESIGKELILWHNEAEDLEKSEEKPNEITLNQSIVDKISKSNLDGLGKIYNDLLEDEKELYYSFLKKRKEVILKETVDNAK